MKTLKFKCTLLSDVILNVKSASEGLNSTLDFIPGSNFLGIVAGRLYNELSPEASMELFHSGNVRFSDADPGIGGIRSFKAPASIYYPKGRKLSDASYVYHKIPSSVLSSDDFRKKQIKQLREGFFISKKETISRIPCEKSFSVKSAYDRTVRRSKDECMYTYESLARGGEYYFSVELQDDKLADNLADRVVEALVGERHIGRSKTAQYGRVKIEQTDYSEVAVSAADANEIAVYADGRLIFLDEYGCPHFRPSADDLGLPGGEIVWSKCQIRTFQYSPWNFKRQAFDADRCGIEKGSVFIVNCCGCNRTNKEPQYIGFYKNEGFGRVIYNPAFLEAEPSSGLCKCRFVEDNNVALKYETPITAKSDSLLLEYVAQEQRRQIADREIYNLVNKFVAENGKRFSGAKFASQWGQIRNIAVSSDSFSDLKYRLLDKDNGYLYHGIASTKWVEAGRRSDFEERFMDELDDDRNHRFSDADKCHAVINLASEMAKRTKKQ